MQFMWNDRLHPAWSKVNEVVGFYSVNVIEANDSI
jgi:hypothetical protein